MESSSTEVLRDEHRLILQIAGALEEILDEGGMQPDFDAVEKCVRFFRLFADACHHGKEEDLLFPALIDQGMSREAGPIAVMLHEHTIGRRHVSSMAASLDGARSGDSAALLKLTRAGRDYIELIRGHILKEDNVLFNMADQLVSGQERLRLCAAYDGTCDHTFEGCTKAQLEELAAEILGRG